MKLNNLTRGGLFFFILIIISFLYNYHEILFSGPYSIHAWRQADCLSITLNYFKENLSFLSPEVHWIGDKGHGKTISEFPIIYYSVAQLWKVLGQHESIFRLINIVLVFSGLYSLHKLSFTILKDRFWSFFIPLFLFTSPLLIYYTNNFLTNAPAFGLALTAAYFYYLFDTSSRKKWLVLSMLFFTLSGLLKVTSLIIFTAIVSIIVLNGILQITKRKKTVKKLIFELLPFISVVLIIATWYVYARSYNHQNHSDLFLQGIFPIWELSPEKRHQTLELLYWNLIPSYFNKKILFFLVVLFLFLFFVIKKTNHKLHSVLIVTFGGMMLYGILWFRALHVHDYYLTNLLIFIPLILVVFLDYLNNSYNKVFRHPLLKSIFFVVLIFLITQGAVKNRLKYNSKEYFAASNLFIKKSEKDNWDYNHWSYNNNFKAFETITPYMRKLGIERTDKIICMSDASINISLYLMDQKGLTRYGFGRFSDNERINFAIEQNCSYLIITEKDLTDRDIDIKYLQHQIGQYQNIYIYKIS